jgi:FkbM family methyltransferase
MSKLYKIVDTKHGRFLCNVNDYYIGSSMINYGEWAESQVELFLSIVKEGDVVLDVGANMGSHTIPMSRAVGDTGQVYAFEPQRLVHQLLCANIAINECFNVYVEQSAVSDKNGVVDIPDIPPVHPRFNYGGVSIGRSVSGSKYAKADLKRIDDLHIERLDFLKIDAEGHDLQVMLGAVNAIRKNRPAIFVEVDESSCSNIKEFLVEEGYDVFWHTSNLFNERNYLNCQNYIWQDDGVFLVSADFLAIPKLGRWTVSGLDPVPEDNIWNSLPNIRHNYRSGLSVVRSMT